jgi:hypothetical protein
MNARRYSLWLLILIVMGVLGTPISAQGDSHTVVYDNIRFSFPSSLATGLQIETVEAIPLLRPDEQFWVETYPEHIRFNFVNYLDGSCFQLPLSQYAYPNTAQILVYTTASFHEFGYDFLDQLNALDALLQERPDLSTYVGAWVGLPEEAVSLPFLPWLNATQVLRSHPQYVEIAGVGSGIRYVTYYSQEAAPITDQRIFYNFQGLMAGGAYYVSAIFPVKTGVLPEEVDTSNIDWDTFAANYSEYYLPEAFALIDSLPDEAFYPSLSTLDALIQSIAFETEATAWQSYSNVTVGFRFQYPPNRQVCAFENSIGLIYGVHYYDDPDADHCALVYQANPISVVFSTGDDAFQAFRAENHPNSFVDFQEEVINIGGRAATRISGREVETNLPFELVRIEHNDSYLIFRAMGDENIDVLREIIATLHFASDVGS